MATNTVVEYDAAINLIKLRLPGADIEISSSHTLSCKQLRNSGVEIDLRPRRVRISGNASVDHYVEDNNTLVISVNTSTGWMVRQMGRYGRGLHFLGGPSLSEHLQPADGRERGSGFLGI